MKQFRVRVNGQEFEVEIEEIISKRQATREAVSEEPRVEKKPVQEPKRKKEEPKPEKKPKARAGGEPVESPLPGTVMDIRVKSGDKVSAGDVLLILEAMKMENEIVAPVDGEVGVVHVNQGDTVEIGDLLAEIV